MSSGRPFTAACIQTSTGLDPETNIAATLQMVRSAAAQGAHLIMTPEMTNVIDMDRKRLMTRVHRQAHDPSVAAFAACARETGSHLLAGSLALAGDDGRLLNRSLLFAPDGNILAHYDKVHMFDVDLPGGESYRESSAYAAGSRAVIVPTDLGPIGMTICYDLRFPALYRYLAQAGAAFITIPSAFTRPTGQAHWQVLLQARAIETGCFIFAPAQTGDHECGRKTYGHSMMVAPWGEVIAEAGLEPGIILAQIDPNRVSAARRRIPALQHDRKFAPPPAARRVMIEP
jgi:predicted amidohydrolase